MGASPTVGDETASVPDDLPPDELTVAEALRLLALPKSDEPIGQLDGFPVYAKNGRFGPYVDLYRDMLNKQLTYDALRIIGFDVEMMQGLGAEMVFMGELANAGKIAQGLFVARKRA